MHEPAPRPRLYVTEIEALLTNPDNPNIINFDLWKQAAGGRHQIGTMAGFRSEQVAGFLLEYMAGFVGIRNYTPFTSEAENPLG